LTNDFSVNMLIKDFQSLAKKIVLLPHLKF
jgi:hypothetical protein